MKNLHKNKNKRGDDPIPTPKSHNILIGSHESSPTTKTHKNKENKITHETHKTKQTHKKILNLHNIYTGYHTPRKTHSHPINNKITHIYKTNTPKNKYIPNHQHHQSQHTNIHKNIKTVIITINGSTTSKFHLKMITNKNTILISTTKQKQK